MSYFVKLARFADTNIKLEYPLALTDDCDLLSFLNSYNLDPISPRIIFLSGDECTMIYLNCCVSSVILNVFLTLDKDKISIMERRLYHMVKSPLEYWLLDMSPVLHHFCIPLVSA